MNEILIAIETLATALGKFKNIVSNTIKEISDKREELDSIGMAQDERTKNLDAREKEIKKIENIVELKESAQKLVNQAEAAAKELLNNQRMFNETAIKQNKEITDNQRKNENDRISNDNESKALIKLRQELEEEKANFKLRIAKGLVE